jgi:hypothetical protein
MVSRKIVTDKYRTIAKLLLGGESFYRALRQGGYSRASARNPKLVLEHCWGLRQAIVEAQKASSLYFRVPPARQRRHDRRPVARFVAKHCNANFEETSSNRGVREYVAAEKKASEIVADRTFIPTRCSWCRGPLEGKDRWCPNCQRVESGL